MTKKKRIIISLCVVIVAVVFYVDTSIRSDYESPLYVGKIFSTNFLLGNKDSLINVAGSKELIKKIKSANIKTIEPEWLKNDVIGELAWIYHLKLYKADRLFESDILILTYAFIDPNIQAGVHEGSLSKEDQGSFLNFLDLLG